MYQRAAAYIRVSTDEQSEYSPDAQLKAIKKYCKDNNILLDSEHIYIDEGISGRKAEKRPAFQDMIKHAKKKEFDVILVHKFDRFARSREDSVVYKSLLKKECNIRVVSITESIEDDKFSVILEAMLEAMAEYYSLNLSDEVKKGMTEKAQRGEYQSSPPFGYKMENKTLVILDDEAEAVKLVFNAFLDGQGLLQIAKKLNDLGYRTHRGNKFENRTIEYMLNNPVYCGMARWTPTGKIKRNYKCEDTLIVESNHDAIIDKKTFDLVQEKLNERKQINRRFYKGTNPQNLHWLNGLVRCKLCGCTFVRNQKEYYNCNGYVKGKCSTSQNVKIELIEQAILNQIKEDFSKPTKLINRCKTVSNNDVNIILSQLEKLPEKEARAKEAYLNGIDSLEEYKENKKMIENQKKVLEKSLQQYKKPVKNIDKTLKDQLKTVYEMLIDPKVTMQEKYEISHLIIDDIIFEKATATLFLTYKYQLQ